MSKVLQGLFVGGVILVGLCGCRAMSKNDPTALAPAPAAPAASAPAAQGSKPTPGPSPAASPAPAVKPVDSKADANVFLLREALGQSLLPLIDGNRIGLQKTVIKGGSDPNITIEGGKLTLYQLFQGSGGGQGSITVAGGYQKLATTSGEALTYVNPMTIDFSFTGLAIQTGCYGTMSVTGKVRCSLSGTYTQGIHSLTGTGQCMTHTNGILDNLRLDGGGESHKVRYTLGFKVRGDPQDWRSYQWVGSAYINGQNVDITHLNDIQNICNK